MTKKSLATALGILGWSLGWGLSWAFIVSYQRSTAPEYIGFGSRIPEFDLGWYVRISSFFGLGWLIAGFSTSSMIMIDGKVNMKYGMVIGILWGLIALPIGGILSWIFNHIPGDEFIYFVYQAVFYLILLPIGFGIVGFTGVLATSKILEHQISLPSKVIDLIPDITWGIGATIGSIVGVIIFLMGGTDPSESAFFSGLVSGILGGLVAGSISNMAIWKNLDKQKVEVVY
jgi:hypothetical protein